MTCCCVAIDTNLFDLAKKHVGTGTDEAEAIVRQWRTSEDGAVELAAILFEPDGKNLCGSDNGRWKTI